MRFSTRLGAVVLLAAFTGLLAGCVRARPSPSPSPGAAAPPNTVQVRESEFRIDPAQITVRAGAVTFSVKNAGAVAHNFVVEDAQGRSLGRTPDINPGGTAQLSVNLSPGRYTAYCAIPGHREAGMVATVTAAG